jgi:hypothetical protein
MAKTGDDRRRDDPTPEEIEKECERIRKGWGPWHRNAQQPAGTKPWRLPEIHPAEDDAAAEDDAPA